VPRFPAMSAESAFAIPQVFSRNSRHVFGKLHLRLKSVPSLTSEVYRRS
jgi:hypothetical protein